MLNCRKLRKQPASAGGSSGGGYLHPEEAAARRRGGLFVSATRAVTATDSEGNEYTAYLLRCSYVEEGGRVSWEVRRRYNDFYTLHTKLKRYGAVVAELPSRNPFAKMASVVRSREIGLQEYLQAVLSHCNDKQCSYLAKFLQVQKNLPSYQARVQSKVSDQPAPSQGHRVAESWDGDGERGRSTASESADSRRVRAKSMPRGFGKRSRPAVDGVPRSSLFARDDSSAEFSRIFKRAADMHGGTDSSDDEVPNFAVWDAGRRRRQARVAEVVECGECGVCEGDDSDVTLAPSAPGRLQIGESTARQQLQILQQLRQKREKSTADGSDTCDLADNRDCELRELAGIGLFFVQRDEGACIVDEVVAGGAAELSGRIKVGDVLLNVDGHSVQGLELPAIRHLIIGRPGTGVTLDFSRKLPATRRARFGALSDEEVSSDDESVLVVRRRYRGAGRGGGEDEVETHFVVHLVRAVQLRTVNKSDEGPSPADHSVAAASILALEMPADGSEVKEESDNRRRGEAGEGVRVKSVAPKDSPLHGNKPDTEGEGDAASNSSAQSLSHRSTVVANLSGHSSGDDVCIGGAGASSSAPATPNMQDKAAPSASVDQVCAWLYEVELGEYVSIFQENKIDGEMLQDLTEDDLVADFGMTNKYHRRRLLGKRTMCAVSDIPAEPLSSSAVSAATTASAPNSANPTPVHPDCKELTA